MFSVSFPIFRMFVECYIVHQGISVLSVPAKGEIWRKELIHQKHDGPKINAYWAITCCHKFSFMQLSVSRLV